jgi:hypothetical protein
MPSANFFQAIFEKFLKNGLKKICRKNYKIHFRSNNYEVYKAAALCISNILDGMVLENIMV